jgi:hypothetical protein
MHKPAPDTNHEGVMMQVNSTTLRNNQNNDPVYKISNMWPQSEPLANKVYKLVEEIRRLGEAERHVLLRRLIPGLTIAIAMELEDLSIWVCVLYPKALYISN